LQSEFESTADEAIRLIEAFGFENIEYFLSKRPEAERTDTDPIAEDAIRKALESRGLPYQIDEGGGAFYGPKLDIMVHDAIGRRWQLGTVQVDFILPKRFDLKYRGSDGADHTPVMIHRALAGSLERFFGVLIEHYGGAFPAWLAPVQAVIVADLRAPARIRGGRGRPTSRRRLPHPHRRRRTRRWATRSASGRCRKSRTSSWSAAKRLPTEPSLRMNAVLKRNGLRLLLRRFLLNCVIGWRSGGSWSRLR
jgi:hypothetical protein